MWTDNRLQVINEGDQYVSADGTTYPANFPKAEIPGLFPVTLTPRPDDALNSVHGFSIDENHAQVWIYTPRTVEQMAAMKTEAQSDRWEAIKAERDRRKAGGVKVGDKWFHSDDASRIQQIGLVMMGANIPAGLQWKTMDGTFVTMTQALAGQIFQAVAAQDQAIFSKAEQHKAAMEAADNPAIYDFSQNYEKTNWPLVYGE